MIFNAGEEHRPALDRIGSGILMLEKFGFEIYASIDGYSRFIVRIYIEVSARTAISVLRQYLDAAQSNGSIPRVLRVDLGTETVQLGDTYLLLRRSANNLPGYRTTVQLGDCFFYGRSVENQPIEAWWGQLATSSLFLYYEYLHKLQKEGHFSRDYIPEQVSLLAIYMPILRSRIHSYVNTYNIYPIRA
ncbi:hypothetical protein N7532_002952 [Penicillium argentinense]|uniref:Integrase core domain-containing protein n=1 Tax=Penicillium argentinense TaxID=1131581 RepID=A0A9W9G1F5_9EURO|nr:uncharacterized protein N7532_002952 [Penicillium argentinense]KAJ5110307.1 hypothetical protein N7532_002952 [Penicillium argentinense]